MKKNVLIVAVSLLFLTSSGLVRGEEVENFFDRVVERCFDQRCRDIAGVLKKHAQVGLDPIYRKMCTEVKSSKADSFKQSLPEWFEKETGLDYTKENRRLLVFSLIKNFLIASGGEVASHVDMNFLESLFGGREGGIEGEDKISKRYEQLCIDLKNQGFDVGDLDAFARAAQEGLKVFESGEPGRRDVSLEDSIKKIARNDRDFMTVYRLSSEEMAIVRYGLTYIAAFGLLKEEIEYREQLGAQAGRKA